VLSQVRWYIYYVYISDHIKNFIIMAQHHFHTNYSDYSAETKYGLNNIPTEGFVSIDNQTTTTTAVVRQNVKGYFKLSLFAIAQFINGANLYAFVRNDSKVSGKEMHLLSRLALLALNAGNDGFETSLGLDREEVTILKNLLTIRMQHCEKERDERSENFNPDTYIGQKLLLLDIREWLMCDVIEDKPIPVAQAVANNWDNEV
jgi:hypothetical protein